MGFPLFGINLGPMVLELGNDADAGRFMGYYYMAVTVAQIAGIMGAKRTPELIPMCHPILLQGVDLSLRLDEERCAVDIRAAVRCEGKTGVEMEALTAAAAAALTVYDMCKAVQKDMVITDLRLISKSGGIHGDYHEEEEGK